MMVAHFPKEPKVVHRKPDRSAQELAESVRDLLDAMGDHKHEDGYYTLKETGHFQIVRKKLQEFDRNNF